MLQYFKFHCAIVSCFIRSYQVKPLRVVVTFLFFSFNETVEYVFEVDTQSFVSTLNSASACCPHGTSSHARYVGFIEARGKCYWIMGWHLLSTLQAASTGAAASSTPVHIRLTLRTALGVFMWRHYFPHLWILWPKIIELKFNLLDIDTGRFSGFSNTKAATTR
jgi:hypothetical protein